MGFREDIRGAIEASGAETEPEAPESSTAERVAETLRDRIIWPERPTEVRRQELMEEVKREARGG